MEHHHFEMINSCKWSTSGPVSMFLETLSSWYIELQADVFPTKGQGDHQNFWISSCVKAFSAWCFNLYDSLCLLLEFRSWVSWVASGLQTILIVEKLPFDTQSLVYLRSNIATGSHKIQHTRHINMLFPYVVAQSKSFIWVSFRAGDPAAGAFCR